MSFFKHERAVVDPEASIGEGTRIWVNAQVQAGASVGKNCNICNGSFIEKGSVVGNNVTIKHNVSIFDGVEIGDDCFIGSNIAFINDRHPRSHREDQWILEKTFIRKGASLGSNAVIMCGITVGEYAVIGAGSVVLKDVKPYAIMCGNPAVFKGFACLCGRKLDAQLQCSCGKKYQQHQESLRLQ
ncbi:MAG: N-acetyltransferase [Candidatus Omnitrophica bacterium]|nr:N-acetyltransferase [Candidatus Omnitrophota bacterium]